MNRYLLGGIVAGISFGTAAIFIRMLHQIPSMSIAFWRLIIGGAVLALASYALKTGDIKHGKGELKLIIVMGSLLALHFILFIQAVKDTSVINATTLVNTSPIQALIISMIAFRTSPTRISVVSVFLGFLGALIMGAGGGIQPHTVGDVEALISGTLIAIYANVGRVARRSYEVNSLQFMYRVYVVAAVIVAAISLVAEGRIVTPQKIHNALALIGLGLVPTGIGHTLMVFSLKELKAYEAETLALLEPISASTLALIIFGEIPTSSSMVGFMFILISTLLLSVGLLHEEGRSREDQ